MSAAIGNDIPLHDRYLANHAPARLGESDPNGYAAQQQQMAQALGQSSNAESQAIGQEYRGMAHDYANQINTVSGAANSQQQGAANVARQTGAAAQGNLSALGAQAGGAGQSLYAQGNQMQGRQALQGQFGQQTQELASSDNTAQTVGQTAQALGGLEAQQGPSAAQAQLQSATNQGMNNALSLARSGRGYGGSASALAQAQGQQGTMSANAANQSAALSAQEQAAWRQRQASNLTAAGGLQGQQAGIYQQSGAQYGQQAQANLAAAQQNRAQNDQAQVQLAGLGLQGMNQQGNLEQAAYNTNLQAQALGASTAQNSTNANLSAMQGAGALDMQGGQQMLSAHQLGTQQAMQGQTLGLQTAQAEQQAENQTTQNALTQYGIESGVDVANNQQQMQMIGAGMSGAGMLMAMSDEREKDVGERVKLSSPTTGNPYGRTGAPGAGFGSESREKSDEAHRQERFRNSMQTAAALARSSTAPPQPAPNFRPTFQQSAPVQFGAPPGGAVMSDERNKKELERLRGIVDALGADRPAATEGVAKRPVDYGALDAAQSAPPPDFSKAPAYSYTYKDPTMPGAAPGRQVGPMAQDLERAGSQSVMDTQQGKMVDPARLTMENSSAIGEQQDALEEQRARQRDLERQLAELAEALKADDARKRTQIPKGQEADQW